MRNRKSLISTLAAVMVLVAAPLLAQQGSQSGTSPSSSSAAEPVGVHATGTIASINDARLELWVDKLTGASPAASSSMVGKTQVFNFDSNSDKPAGLRNGDKVEVWYRVAGNDRFVTRIEIAESATSTSTGSSQPAGSGYSSMPTTAETSPMSESSSEPSKLGLGEPSSSTPISSDDMSQQAAGQDVSEQRRLPQTASQVPLLGVIGLLALAGALTLRFVFRS